MFFRVHIHSLNFNCIGSLSTMIFWISFSCSGVSILFSPVLRPRFLGFNAARPPSAYCFLTDLTCLSLTSEYRDNEKEYLDYYDEVEVCAESSEAHPKSAIQVRNRSMIDRADLVVCCIQHKSGGAYATIRYAEKQGKKIVNLADEN